MTPLLTPTPPVPTLPRLRPPLGPPAGAGGWGTCVALTGSVAYPGAPLGSARLGDRAALHARERACYFLDYTYLTCPDQGNGRMRYRPGFSELRGRLLDQAALLGVLTTLFDLGLPLRSVDCLATPGPPDADAGAAVSADPLRPGDGRAGHTG